MLQGFARFILNVNLKKASVMHVSFNKYTVLSSVKKCKTMNCNLYSKLLFLNAIINWRKMWTTSNVSKTEQLACSNTQNTNKATAWWESLAPSSCVGICIYAQCLQHSSNKDESQIKNESVCYKVTQLNMNVQIQMYLCPPEAEVVCSDQLTNHHSHP